MDYAVIDIETTGLSPAYHHRIVEIGVVVLDRGGSTVDEWCTLVNPQRDLGPQHIHGIRAREVRDAPTFADVAGTLAGLVAGKVVVAHNLLFDLRFLVAEYARLGARVPLDAEHGLCTMHLSDQYLSSPARSLVACCATAGITHDEVHSALHDARACARLLAHCLPAASRPEPWAGLWPLVKGHTWPALPAGTGRTHGRHSAGRRTHTFLARLIDRLPRAPHSARANDYLALLDRALLDRRLSAGEQDALIETATQLNLTLPDTMQLHREYLTALAAAAWQDGVVTEDERRDLLTVADLLGLTAQEVDIALDAASNLDAVPREEISLVPGDVIAFTGQMPGARDEYERRAAARGLKVGDNVTKATRLLVAADPDSLSGKAKKARQYGLPIIGAGAFDELLATVRDRP
jgi:DNA polymerase-3 subunit epsilon